MYRIEIHNAQSVLPLDEEFLREVARRTLADEQVAAAEISVAVVDNPTIHRLNRQFLQHDDETDVLSFLLDAGQDASGERGPSAAPTGKIPAGVGGATELPARRGVGKRIAGEVIVSAEMAAQRAAEFSWRPQDELVLYLVHGLLHLVGYDDLTEDEQQVMRRRERAVLALWNLVPAAASAGHGGVSEASGSVVVRRE